jgi:hypothetical protein
VVVLSPEFVRKEFPMRELQIFLERKARDPSSIVIVPVFYELTVEQCENLEQLYDSEPWPSSPGVPKVEDRGVLKGWAEAVKQLLDATGAKIEEVRDGEFVRWRHVHKYAWAVQMRHTYTNCAYDLGITLAETIWAACCRPTTTRVCWLGRWWMRWWSTSLP